MCSTPAPGLTGAGRRRLVVPASSALASADRPDGKPLEREEIEALVEALIEEARRETRRRHRRYWAVAALGTLVGVVVLCVAVIRTGLHPDRCLRF
jgi:hypothetical protein